MNHDLHAISHVSVIAQLFVPHHATHLPDVSGVSVGDHEHVDVAHDDQHAGRQVQRGQHFPAVQKRAADGGGGGGVVIIFSLEVYR